MHTVWRKNFTEQNFDAHKHTYVPVHLSSYFSVVLQDCTSVQPQAECGLHCGYHTCLPAGGLIWH